MIELSEVESSVKIGRQLCFYTDATLGCTANMLTALKSVQSHFGPDPLHIWSTFSDSSLHEDPQSEASPRRSSSSL